MEGPVKGEHLTVASLDVGEGNEYGCALFEKWKVGRGCILTPQRRRMNRSPLINCKRKHGPKKSLHHWIPQRGIDAVEKATPLREEARDCSKEKGWDGSKIGEKAGRIGGAKPGGGENRNTVKAKPAKGKEKVTEKQRGTCTRRTHKKPSREKKGGTSGVCDYGTRTLTMGFRREETRGQCQEMCPSETAGGKSIS